MQPGEARLKAYISQVVRDKQGCKATELPVFFMDSYQDNAEAMNLLSTLDFIDVVDAMTKTGELVEVEYVLANLPGRCKSFLLPQDTVLSGHCKPNCMTCEG